MEGRQVTARKRFDRDLWLENDEKAKIAFSSLLKGKKGFTVKDNSNTKGVDLLLCKNGSHVANVEVEIKKDKKWNVDFPYSDVQFPFRKKKFAELEKPTYFVVFNHDQTKYLVVRDVDLLQSKIQEVKNRFVPNGELFFKVLLDNIYFNEVDIIIKGDAACRGCATLSTKRWHHNHTMCDSCYEKKRKSNLRSEGSCKSCGSQESIQWLKNRTECNKCYQQKNKQRKFSVGKSHAKAKGLEFSIDKELYFNTISKGCFYCGEILNNRGTGYSLDRIDNTKGYSKDNILPCCGECNRIRSDIYTVEEMKTIGKILKTIKTVKAHNEGI